MVLGPVLTGIAFQADAMVNLARTDPAEVTTLGTEIRPGGCSSTTWRDAVSDAIDAVRRHAQRLDRRADGQPLTTWVTAPERLPAMPAAVEVAAYRILTESLTNVARHSSASSAQITISPADGALSLRVDDDGRSDASPHPWRPGVGLRSLHDRSAELGGSFSAGPTAGGGRVSAQLPLEPVS